MDRKGKKPTYRELRKKIPELEKVEIESPKTKEVLDSGLYKQMPYSPFTLFEFFNDAIFLQKGNTFLKCNQKALELFGCTSEQITGKTHLDFSPEYQSDGSLSSVKTMEIVELSEKGSLPDTIEWRFCRYDGTSFDVELSLNKIEAEGEIYFLSIARESLSGSR